MNFKKIATFAACAAAVSVHAQSSSVTIYGTVGLGFTHVSNGGGSSRFLQESGVLRASRLGFSGVENLGNGKTAIFTLESGFFADTGASGQGGRLFGRQAFVGLSDTNLGTVSLGRQYDMMNRLVRYSTAGDVGAVYGFHHGDYDRVSGFRIDNSIKYVTPMWSGFQAAMLAAPGEGTGARTFSGGVSYVKGPIDVALSYSKTHKQAINPSTELGVATFLGAAAGAVTVDSIEPWGIGAAYDFGSYRVHASYSNVKISNVGRSTSLRSIDLGGSYAVGVASIGLGVTHSRLGDASWTQLSAGYIYNLSKNTKLYTNINYQRAHGSARNAVMPTLIASTTRSQLVPHVGLTMNF